jgi:hypothetical protein
MFMVISAALLVSLILILVAGTRAQAGRLTFAGRAGMRSCVR